MSYGEGDPSIPESAKRLHLAACRAGQATYKDPQSGYDVLTADFLARRELCCGSGCRHCPFAAAEQRRAGRDSIRPTSG